MEEKRFYDPIGGWLIRKKGCQRDEYSQGYLKTVQVENIIPDVFSIRYEIIDNVYPAIHFHGYLVEVKKSEKGLDNLIGKVIRTKSRVEISEEWMWGLHTVRLYIAYPTEQVSRDVFEICEKEGIGILRLQVNDEVNIYEVLESKEIMLNGMAHSRQRSIGTFIDGMNEISYLRQMFQQPWKLYDDFIRPKIERYRKEIEIRQDMGYPTNEESRKSRDCLIERIKSEFSKLELDGRGRDIWLKHSETDRCIFSIEQTTEYFYVLYENHRRYRICSNREIIEFRNGEGKRYEGDLENLITLEIIPYIKTKLLKEKRM
jgi:hypothetical protein